MVNKCLGQDYKAFAWQRAGKGRVIAYLEAGEGIPAATLERFHVVNAGGSRGQYVYLEPRAQDDALYDCDCSDYFFCTACRDRIERAGRSWRAMEFGTTSRSTT